MLRHTQFERHDTMVAHQDSNLEPKDYESSALTIELWARVLIVAIRDVRRRLRHDADELIRSFRSFLRSARSPPMNR